MIVIYGIKENLNPIKSKMSTVIHDCLMSSLGLPEHKRFHRFIPMDKEDFFYSLEDGRTDSYTVLEVNLMEGRKKETIKSLIKAILALREVVWVVLHIFRAPAACRSAL